MPPPPKDHKTTPHLSHINRGNKPITSTCMAKSSSSTPSNIKLAGNGKTSLHEEHHEIAQLQEKSQYEKFIKERDEFFRKKFLELF